MENTTRVTGMSQKLMGMGSMYGLMVISMWGNGINVSSKGMGMTCFLTEMSMKDAISRGNFMDEAGLNGRTEWSMMGIFEMG